MRRFLTLVCLLCLAIPAGVSISGCTRNPGENYCNGLGYGEKITDVDSISLSPQTGGISMAFGQTRQVGSPTAKTCKGVSASVSSYNYGTTNNQLVDISPSGNICAGTWNRNSGGGIANYTTCSPPSPLPATGGLPYATAYVTASAQSVTSNPVEIYVHAPVTSLNLVGPTQCLSQGTLWSAPLDVQAYYATGNPQAPQALLCSPSTTDCTNVIGTLAYTVANSTVASINNETNQITAEMPGTTLITATVGGSSSSAGYFSTCPPASISVTLANGATNGAITQGVTQNLVTTVTDTNGKTISGLTLEYQSTDLADISATSTGSVSTNFPGVASLYAICQPPSCNPAPINFYGLYGTGLPISSNPVDVTVPGTASQYVWYGAPNVSQYFVPVELLTGTVGASVKLPYVPNSMVMDKSGNSLYFGSSHELMVYSALSNSLTKLDVNAPGVVLAVSPDGSQLVINDPIRQVLYLYSSTGGVSATFGGMGATAAYTPDSSTIFITDSAALGGNHADTIYIYNANTGWASYPLPCSTGSSCANKSNGAQSVAVMVPGVGAFASGYPTVSHTWCPSGVVGNSASMVFYPQADSLSLQTDVLAATTDGKHILGAALNGSTVTLSDIGVSIPTTTCPGVSAGAQNGATLSPLTTNAALTASMAVSKINAAAVNQVIASPASSLVFLTYTGTTGNTNAQLPYYIPSTGGAGTLNYLPLTGGSAISAPIAGAFSPDNKLFFVSTAGDNKIHYIDITGATPKDTQQISPNLPACTPVSQGGVDPGCNAPANGPSVVPASVITVRPRATT